MFESVFTALRHRDQLPGPIVLAAELPPILAGAQRLVHLKAFEPVQAALEAVKTGRHLPGASVIPFKNAPWLGSFQKTENKAR